MEPIVLAGGATRRNRRGKRPDAAANARPRKVAVTHAGASRALRLNALDQRTRMGRAYRQHVQALAAHLGGAPSVPEERLIDQASRLRLLTPIAWAEIERWGGFRRGEPRPAVESYRKAAADEREVLRMLGLQRRQKPVPTLDDYLSGHGPQDA